MDIAGKVAALKAKKTELTKKAFLLGQKIEHIERRGQEDLAPNRKRFFHVKAMREGLQEVREDMGWTKQQADERDRVLKAELATLEEEFETRMTHWRSLSKVESDDLAATEKELAKVEARLELHHLMEEVFPASEIPNVVKAAATDS